MFRRTLQMQVVKTPKSKTAPEVPTAQQLTPEQFSHVAKEQTKNAALLIGAVYVTKVVFDTAQEIALIITKSKFR